MGKQTLHMNFHVMWGSYMELYLFYLQHILAWCLKLSIAYDYCSITATKLPSCVAQYVVVLRRFFPGAPAATMLKEITLTPNNCIFVLAVHCSLLCSVGEAHSLSLTVVTSRASLDLHICS